MILPNMRLEDVACQIRSEESEIAAAMRNKARVFKSESMKARRFPFMRVYSFRTPKFKNEYRVMFRIEKHSQWDCAEPIVYLPFFLKDGYYVSIVTKTRHHHFSALTKVQFNDVRTPLELIFLIPHFWDRVRERLAGMEGMKLDEMVRSFLLRDYSIITVGLNETANLAFQTEQEKSQKINRNAIAAYVPDGMCFGEVTSKEDVVLKTFVPKEMLRNNQSQMMNDIGDYVSLYGI